MVNSISENEKSHSTRLKSVKEVTPKKPSKFADEISFEANFHSDNSKKEKLKLVNKIDTSNNKSCVETNKVNFKEDNAFQLSELKLNIKRIDETNYISILSPSSLKLIEDKAQVNKSPKIVPTTPKNNSNKSLQWNERCKSGIPKLVEELIDTDYVDENYEPNKPSQTISVTSCFDESDSSTVDTFESIVPKRNLRSSISTTPCKLKKIENTLEFDTPRRTRKSVSRFGDPVDLNETVIENSPTINKRKRSSAASSKKSSSMINTSVSITPKRKKNSVNRFGDSVNLNEMKCTQKTSSMLSTPNKTNNSSESLRWNGRNVNDVSKLVAELINEEENCKSNRRISVDSSCSDSSSKVSLKSTISKRKLRESISTSPSKSNKIDNTLEFDTPRRTRKPVDRFGDPVDLNETVIDNSPAKKKRSKTPAVSSASKNSINMVNTSQSVTPKHLRPSMTLTPRSGSKVRRSILQDIPENKEIEVTSTPKTPKKTPKAHVKNLTASVSRRSDSGARVPCSPLEKARANLHLHAAPKHLPCREIEFKSIHSFLARKISDELTGSMYISGVPGTGKTATVKRVIDSLNSDIIMKHSFKFIEINGLRLANPHQAFSVIWKELTAETVSSSRAQALLNDYFSGKKVRELSTILLVDEVDHICNRKQDVVYNILDWPSRTGSKVVVITIANTMDLPERVLRGCVTSRMGLTRLVFKPYTFQQLQEIIMNRLIGNSSFDPDAVQLVARKVAAVSGDARRALDVCRRAIDLIKSEDESQFITINHVNQVLNSILSGVRVTAIRQCSVLEQYFLKALRDETNRTGFDHSTIDSVYVQMKNICLLEGEELPNDQQVIMMAYRLRDSGLIFLEKKRWDVFRKVSLNVSPEDISYALDKYNL